MNRNLTENQLDYARFLPAVSGFYATFIGKQRREEYVDYNRVPKNFVNGVESLNFLDPTAQFTYKWCLYSAGHATLDLNKDAPGEDMFRNRDRSTSWALGDSGGFQIGKGVWEGDWKDPNCPKASKKRELVLKWMDALMDYGMILDIPAWVSRSEAGQKATGIKEYKDALAATDINNEYFMKNTTGACNFLNVLQGENHTDADNWYAHMKHYSDPSKFPETHFKGWAMGGQNMCDVHLVLKRLIALRYDGLLEKGKHDVMHFLGTSKLEWATLLTDVQRAVRKYHNENFTATFDCASPFLATANGQVYTSVETEDRKKWVYRMIASADDKKYSTDTRPWRDGVLADGIFPKFEDSPITDGLTMKDVCIYAPGDLNKVGKEGRTSWDSFSYAIQMGHNVWTHINAVQEANRQYDSGKIPAMLIDDSLDRVMFRDVVEAIFATDKRDEAEMIIEEYSRYWMSIIGTRGAVGKKTMNASTQFANLFETA